MSICASIPSEGPGLMYAVRRTCGEKATCKDICTDAKLRKQGRHIKLIPKNLRRKVKNSIIDCEFTTNIMELALIFKI